MLRQAFLTSTRAASRWGCARATPIARSNMIRSSILPTRQQLGFQAVRCYAASSGLSKEEVQGRILDLLKNFDKVTDPSKLSGTSHFSNDLGLDSLDTVEVVMAIEEEFSIEIPDKEADAIHSVEQAVNYILSQPDAH
ncbi:acyl carrier protein [Verruconis gallopava]|uniref:Acyl carrier protein n=1 Tax=Verruconis gallopava TaxID=253628 RepID=A0A0D1XL78_9PEZI|nr:acyl carrier protein [Verruconis gallopava]KIW03151.1 acyl carrier protein [Verruconis gallopava]